METKINVHSVIDLITNSSTELFMDFSGSIKPLKELINEIFIIGGIDKTCDDVFELSIRPEWWENEDYEFDQETWEEDHESMTILHIKTKDESYSHLVSLVTKFINSINLEEYNC